ncbi:MAG: hypothetical protein LBO06_05095 [Bacteroidales bacterium]|jgi:hypothetical protein|nr:hypothetical protein [Bacteroidales bacterium]
MKKVIFLVSVCSVILLASCSKIDCECTIKVFDMNAPNDVFSYTIVVNDVYEDDCTNKEGKVGAALDSIVNRPIFPETMIETTCKEK